MEHMNKEHPLNKMVTTATALVKLECAWDDEVRPDRDAVRWASHQLVARKIFEVSKSCLTGCLLYTSDAADD